MSVLLYLLEILRIVIDLLTQHESLVLLFILLSWTFLSFIFYLGKNCQKHHYQQQNRSDEQVTCEWVEGLTLNTSILEVDTSHDDPWLAPPLTGASALYSSHFSHSQLLQVNQQDSPCYSLEREREREIIRESDRRIKASSLDIMPKSFYRETEREREKN